MSAVAASGRASVRAGHVLEAAAVVLHDCWLAFLSILRCIITYTHTAAHTHGRTPAVGERASRRRAPSLTLNARCAVRSLLKMNRLRSNAVPSVRPTDRTTDDRTQQPDQQQQQPMLCEQTDASADIVRHGLVPALYYKLHTENNNINTAPLRFYPTTISP